jgi:internalin A
VSGSQLPESIGNLSKLKRLTLDNNPFANNIPSEIIRQGWGDRTYLDGNPQVIFDYIREQTTGKRPLHEAKLIFVGFGGVGKTSIVKRLVKDDFDKDEPQTHEVQITKWDVTLNTQAAENIKIHTWDFGGQQIMHSTHQFFLTERSLYVLVLNGRQGQEDEDVEYWLELIKSFGKDSPVIIALNKSNDTPFDLNRTKLRKDFPNIISDGFIPTDCENRQGIDILKQTIIRELDKLDGLRDSFPDKWFSIKDRLAEMSENYIDFEEYRRICQSHGEDNPDKQEKLAYYLHLLGIALNYTDDDRLKDTNILNPHWVTKGVYRVITSDLLNQKLGKLDRSNLSQILDPQEYPRDCYDFLLCLMRKFELCFRFPEAEDLYLIPNLLSKQQPEITTQFDPSHCLNFRYAYPVLPEGLLPRFIVRTHEMNKTQDWWRSGTVLEFEGSRALIKSDRVDKSVSISIRDGNNDNQRRLLAIIRSNFEAIHSNFKFTVVELVPIPKYPQKYHSYQELLAFEQEGILEIPDLINGKVVKTSVEELLNGIKSPAQRKFDRERHLSRRKDDTISGDRPIYNVGGDLIIGDKMGEGKTEHH